MFLRINPDFRKKVHDLIKEINDGENETDEIENSKKRLIFLMEENGISLSRQKIDQIYYNFFDHNGKLKKEGNKELRIPSKALIQNLTELGKKKKKCNTPFLNLKGECMRLYLRGIHDGDGNIKRSFVKNKWRGGEYRLTNNNLIYLENLKKWMKENLNEVKTLNIREVKRKSGIFNELSTGVKEGKEYCEWLYKGYEEYRLNCKYNKYKSITNDEIVQPAQKYAEIQDKELV